MLKNWYATTTNNQNKKECCPDREVLGKLVNAHGLVTSFKISPWVKFRYRENIVLDVMRLDFATLGAVSSPSGRRISLWLVPELITTQLEHRRPIMAVRPPNLQRSIDKITSLGWPIH